MGNGGVGLADVRPGECDIIGEQVGMRFQTGGERGQGWNQIVCVLC